MVHLFDMLRLTNEIFGQLLSLFSRYAANLNMTEGSRIRAALLIPVLFKVDFKRNW